jgi:hypothetical protein
MFHQQAALVALSESEGYHESIVAEGQVYMLAASEYNGSLKQV